MISDPFRWLLRPLYLALRDEIMARSGLQPRGRFWYSHNRLPPPPRTAEKPLYMPNLAGHFEGVLRYLWECHGLGDRCLLVSESCEVAKEMHGLYPATRFVTTQLHPELWNLAGMDVADLQWDVLRPPPPELAGLYSSVIAHALLEHVIDPAAAMLNLLRAARAGGYLYVMTHLPSFPFHRYPRDYVRFHLDWFHDLSSYLQDDFGIFSILQELWAYRGVICACFLRNA